MSQRELRKLKRGGIIVVGKMMVSSLLENNRVIGETGSQSEIFPTQGVPIAQEAHLSDILLGDFRLGVCPTLGIRQGFFLGNAQIGKLGMEFVSA